MSFSCLDGKIIVIWQYYSLCSRISDRPSCRKSNSRNQELILERRRKILNLLLIQKQGCFRIMYLQIYLEHEGHCCWISIRLKNIYAKSRFFSHWPQISLQHPGFLCEHCSQVRTLFPPLAAFQRSHLINQRNPSNFYLLDSVCVRRPLYYTAIESLVRRNVF